jgi:hypothetical protein
MNRCNRRFSPQVRKLRQGIEELGEHALDGRTTLAKVLTQWRSDLIRELGGPGTVTVQQVAIIDLAVRTKLLLDSIDSWLLQQPRLINARKRALIPVVLQRQQLADALAKYLSLLGLKRRPTPVVELDTYLAAHYSDGKAERDLDPNDTTLSQPAPAGETMEVAHEEISSSSIDS